MDEQNEIRNALSSELANTEVMPFEADQKTYENIKAVLAESRSKILTAINSAMVQVYWEIGREINDAIGERAEYGKQLLKFLAERLTADFGKGFNERSLRHMRQFYQTFPIRNAVRSELSWTHYRMLMRVSEPKRREYYLNESIESGWTARQLERQINTLFYERLLATQKSGKESVAAEIFELEPITDADSILKDPYVLEFLDLKENKDYRESELEQALIDNLQDFLLELGKGFSFVARQKRITTDYGKHYHIDLVFYNYILKCFVIIDLKTSDLSFQDVGQIDFYTRLFDDTVKQDNDAPTIGIVLCAGKDETIAKYSVLSDKENLYAANYLSYLPTVDELKAEIKYQRETIERRLLLEKDGDIE